MSVSYVYVWFREPINTVITNVVPCYKYKLGKQLKSRPNKREYYEEGLSSSQNSVSKAEVSSSI